MTTMYRQGDILIVMRDDDSSPAVESIIESGVLAEGEATGHCHRLVGQAILYMAASAMWIKVQQQAQVIHEEHNTIVLPPGDYEVITQRTYTPEKWEKVMD